MALAMTTSLKRSGPRWPGGRLDHSYSSAIRRLIHRQLHPSSVSVAFQAAR
jgi:hypothetical protein